MNDLLRLIRERRAELQRMELEKFGPISDRVRSRALVALIEKAARGDSEAAGRLQQCADLLGEKFQALVVDMAARQEEEPPKNPSDQEDFSEGEPEPEEEPAIAHDVKPDAQGFAHMAPVEQPPQPELPLPWYEDGRSRPGLARANALKRRWKKPEAPDKVDPGISWLKR